MNDRMKLGNSFDSLPFSQKVEHIFRACMKGNTRDSKTVLGNLENIVAVGSRGPQTLHKDMEDVGTDEDIQNRLAGEGVTDPSVRAWFIQQLKSPSTANDLLRSLGEAQFWVKQEFQRDTLVGGPTNTFRRGQDIKNINRRRRGKKGT